MLDQFKILDAYYDMFYSDKTYFIISGGRSSGKTTQVAAYFLIKLVGDEYFRGVIARYTQKSVKSSIYQEILDTAEKWGLKSMIKIEGDQIRYIGNNNMIITHSMKLQEGTMTAKGKGLANVTHLLIDEATELPDEEEYIKLNDTFRTKGVDKKVFIIFNPTSKLHWIHKRWYIDGRPNPKWFVDHCFIHTTYRDNAEIVKGQLEYNFNDKNVEEWERMKTQDPEYYNHHILGLWRDAYEGQIFKDWKFEHIDPTVWIDSTYGMDFGFEGDPTALVQTKIIDDKLYIRELIYDYGLTNPAIYKAALSKSIDTNLDIFADCAEPKSIEELKQLGLKKIKKANKPLGSVVNGIKKIKEYQVIVDINSKNIIEEYNRYCWKPNSDNPVDKFNHAIDAIRYSLSGKKTTGNYGSFGGKRIIQGNENW